MRYTIIYSENYFNGKPAKRYTIENLTIEKVQKVVSFLKEPLDGVLVKFVVYDMTNKIYAIGDNR